MLEHPALGLAFVPTYLLCFISEAKQKMKNGKESFAVRKIKDKPNMSFKLETEKERNSGS